MTDEKLTVRRTVRFTESEAEKLDKVVEQRKTEDNGYSISLLIRDYIKRLRVK